MSVTKPKRGLRSFYPTDKGPIDTYQLGHDGRIEFLAAEIGVEHLSKGVPTTEDWKEWARERGTLQDEPGFIISERLGGSGVDPVNLFPRSKLLDETSWKTDEGRAHQEATEMQKWKKVKAYFKFDYPEDDSLRPSEIEYQYELPDGTILHGKVHSKIFEEPDTTEEFDEDLDSEYEYEYEDEEVEPGDAQTDTPPADPSTPVSVTPPVLLEKEAVVDPSWKSEVSKHVEETKLSEVTPSTTPSHPLSHSAPTASSTFVEPKISTAPSPPKEPMKYDSPGARIETKEPAKSNPKKCSGVDASNRSVVFMSDDVVEFLPVVGSIKLSVDTMKALSQGDGKRTIVKGLQCGLSVFADFHLMRAFARHGKILVTPLTEETLLRFANKAEPQIIIFAVLKAGNQILNAIRRYFSNS